MGELKVIEPGGEKRTALEEYAITPAKVKEMTKEYMALKVPEGDTGAYKIVRIALTTCVSTRTGTDKRRKELGETARAWVGEVNAAAGELIAPLAPVEEHLRAELKREDDRKEAIKQKAIQLEKERVDGIRDMIGDIVSLASGINYDMPVTALQGLLDHLHAIEITADSYMEFADEARKVKADVVDAIVTAMEARKKFDEEEAARKAEDERLAEEKAKLEAEQKVLEEAKAEQAAKEQALEDERLEFEAEQAEAQDKAADKALEEKLEKKAEPEEPREMGTDKVVIGYWLKQIENALDSHHPVLETEEAKAVFRVSYDRIDGGVKFARSLLETL